MKNNVAGFDTESGRAAGRKSKGGGRPRRSIAELMDRGGAVAVDELLRIIDEGENHPHYVEALRELTRACLPKRRVSDVSVGSEPMTFVELARQTMADDDADSG